MEVKGNLNIDGKLTVNDVQVTGGSGVVTVAETDGNPPDFTPNTLIFNSNDFYLTGSSSNQPIVNFRGPTGSGSGLTSITVAESDGNPPNFSTDKVTFNSNDFYLTDDSAGKPVVNFRGSSGSGGGLTALFDDPAPKLSATLNTNAQGVSGNPDVGQVHGLDLFAADGNAGENGGDVNITAGLAPDTGRGGSISIQAGGSVGGSPGNITIESGAGDINLSANFGATSLSISAAGDIAAFPVGDILLEGNGDIIIDTGSSGTIRVGSEILQSALVLEQNSLKASLIAGSSFYIDTPYIILNGTRVANASDPLFHDDLSTKGYVDTRFDNFYRNFIHAGGGGGLSAVVDDTSPQLGGDLDTNNFNITAPGNLTISAQRDVFIQAGQDASGLSNGITIFPGDTFYLNATGAPVQIQGGNSFTGEAGPVAITGGIANQFGDGGSVAIAGGDTNFGTGGSVTILGGSSSQGEQGGVVLGRGDGFYGSLVSFIDPLDMTLHQIMGVATPTRPNDAANKQYVDNVTGGPQPGFYGVVWSDGFITTRSDRLSFGNLYFYLNGRKPTVNLRESGIDHNELANLTAGDPHTQYIRVDGTRAFTGAQSMGSNRLTSVADPTSAQDAATKNYVDTNLGPGFYGIFVRETDGNPPTYRKDTLFFDSNAFYLNSDSVGRPIVSLRYSRPRSVVANFAQGAFEWQVNHNFGTSDIVFSVYDNRQISLIPGKADMSDPNTAYFYFQTQRTGKAVLITVGG